MLLTWNNLAYYQALMAGIRAAIAAGRFADFAARVEGGLGARATSRRELTLRSIAPVSSTSVQPLIRHDTVGLALERVERDPVPPVRAGDEDLLHRAASESRRPRRRSPTCGR